MTMTFKDDAKFSLETLAWAIGFLFNGPKMEQPIQVSTTPRIIHYWLADGDC